MPEPAADNSGFEMETIREGWPTKTEPRRVETLDDIKARGLADIAAYYQARRADTSDVETETKPRRDLGGDILLIALCMVGSFIGAFLGNLTASIW